MTDINIAATPVSAAKASALRYLACLRPQDILVLQGPPLLGAAFAIGHAPLQHLVALALLMIGNVLLVTHIFLLNDWSGLTSDFADPNKAAHVFTTRGVQPRDMGLLTASFFVASLFLFSRVNALAFGLGLAIATLSGLYSLPRFNWKARPLLSSLTHLAGGILHFLLGYSVARGIDGRGVAIAMFFALIFVAGHLTQEVRDHQGDTISGIRTNAVVFGQRRAFIASVMMFAAAQTLLLVLALNEILPRPLIALVALFPLQLHWSSRALREGLGYASVCRLQTRYRILYAVVGMAMAATLYVTTHLPAPQNPPSKTDGGTPSFSASPRSFSGAR